MSGAPLRVARDGAVVRAVMDNPAHRNALSRAMLAAWDALLADLAADASARVLVISGAGGHFCAGLDLTEGGDTDPAAAEARNRAMGARFVALAALPQVVVARIEGACFAGGLGFACAADIALCSAEARFAAPEVRRGLVPAQILPWLVRRMGARAGRFALEGAVLDALSARAAGLVDEVTADAAALDARVAALLAELRQCAPGAVAETKRLLAALMPPPPGTYADLAAASFARAAAGEAPEGIAAFREKRAPGWAVAT
jgi:isohexenylglutaconyl-CoA hydratase